MKFPIFHKYFSSNILIYLVIIELLLFVFMTLPFIFQYNSFLLDVLFPICLIFMFFLYITHYCIAPFFLLLIPIEFYLRKTGRIVKINTVNISLKYQKYAYIIAALIYIAITIVGIIVGQPMTEEELRYD